MEPQEHLLLWERGAVGTQSCGNNYGAAGTSTVVGMWSCGNTELRE